ncbi:MAG TPA: glucose 1-dehydrogenase [Verrucomicrobiae bacterium]
MSQTNQNLTGKVAVVTGASKGIGAAIAKQLAAQGASVVVNYATSQAGADKVVAEIKAKGGNAVAVQANVSRKADIDQLFAATKKHYGAVDILVNNAGIYEFGPLDQITEDHFHRQFNTNVLGLLLTTQAAVSQFNPAGGSIINLSSVVGIKPLPNAAVYSATKAAVDAITKSLATELGGKKIRVNSINPGMIETEGVHAAGFIGTDFQKQLVAQTPLGRIGQPQDVATVAGFLAGNESGWITGETFLVSGGFN